jgi:hypothetical protein
MEQEQPKYPPPEQTDEEEERTPQIDALDIKDPPPFPGPGA